MSVVLCTNLPPSSYSHWSRWLFSTPSGLASAIDHILRLSFCLTTSLDWGFLEGKGPHLHLSLFPAYRTWTLSWNRTKGPADSTWQTGRQHSLTAPGYLRVLALFNNRNPIRVPMSRNRCGPLEHSEEPECLTQILHLQHSGQCLARSAELLCVSCIN